MSVEHPAYQEVAECLLDIAERHATDQAAQDLWVQASQNEKAELEMHARVFGPSRQPESLRCGKCVMRFLVKDYNPENFHPTVADLGRCNFVKEQPEKSIIPKQNQPRNEG